MEFNKNIFQMDCAAETESICKFVKQQVHEMKRDGIIVGLSGGIDSALAAAICVKAVGKDNVIGVILPEKESQPISAQFAEKHAKLLGIETITHDLTGMLTGFGSYDKRDKIVRTVFPEYNDQCKIKITLPPNLIEKDGLNFFTLIMKDARGNIKKKRLKKNAVKGIVAATNTKQRARMIALYYYSEKNNFVVCGTTNKSETIQGFFVQHGDGGVDIEPLAHLYKIQVYILAEFLNVIDEII
ncbi:MAG: NAD(+) synthase [bacterium]|nr:NAD(+) synthase [bacterium]